MVPNPSFWQNVTTYTLGFGLKGTLDPNKDLEAIKAGTKQWPGIVKAGDPTAIDDLWHAAINAMAVTWMCRTVKAS